MAFLPPLVGFVLFSSSFLISTWGAAVEQDGHSLSEFVSRVFDASICSIKFPIKNPPSCSFSEEHVRWHFFHVCARKMRIQQLFQEGEKLLVDLADCRHSPDHSGDLRQFGDFRLEKKWINTEFSVIFLVLRCLYTMKDHC